jgi:hypothetical protein
MVARIPELSGVLCDCNIERLLVGVVFLELDFVAVFVDRAGPQVGEDMGPLSGQA